jgi:hypothetical protein
MNAMSRKADDDDRYARQNHGRTYANMFKSSARARGPSSPSPWDRGGSHDD